MGIKNPILTATVSAIIMTGGSNPTQSNDNTKEDNFEHGKKEMIQKDAPLNYLQNNIKDQTVVCLDTDNPDSYTHKNVLETISHPQSTIIEYPVAQLFQKYGKNKSNHPLYVSGISKTFNSLMGQNGIEESGIDQKLNPRKEPITSQTAYEVGDTLRFALIDQRLKGAFPENLSEQLKEDGFETFSNLDSLEVEPNNNTSRMSEYDDFNKDCGKLNGENVNEDFVYDIVVKKLNGGKSALAVYRNGKLFMVTYVSVGTNNRKTVTGQFKINSRNPYKRSIKYNNSAMPFALNYYGGYYLHQGHVTGRPLSHGCIRLPGVYASLLYSLTKDEDNVDVFIDNNLYKSK